MKVFRVDKMEKSPCEMCSDLLKLSRQSERWQVGQQHAQKFRRCLHWIRPASGKANGARLIFWGAAARLAHLSGLFIATPKSTSEYTPPFFFCFFIFTAGLLADSWPFPFWLTITSDGGEAKIDWQLPQIRPEADRSLLRPDSVNTTRETLLAALPIFVVVSLWIDWPPHV